MAPAAPGRHPLAVLRGAPSVCGGRLVSPGHRAEWVGGAQGPAAAAARGADAGTEEHDSYGELAFDDLI